MNCVVEGIWYDLPYLVIEENLVRIIAEWAPSWLDPCITVGASSLMLKTMTRPRTTKDTQQKPNDTKTEPEPIIMGETIDLEKEVDGKYGDGIEASTMRTTI